MIKKVITPGLAAGVVMLVAGIALSRLYTVIFPALETEYTNAYLFRPWTDPVMSLYFVHPFLVGLLLAWIWDQTKSLFPSSLSPTKKAFRFASFYWMFSICGMLITYSSFPVSLLMVGSWPISTFIEGLLGSMVIVRLNKPVN